VGWPAADVYVYVRECVDEYVHVHVNVFDPAGYRTRTAGMFLAAPA